MSGQVLGHYRVESKLGEGGMGVVYKARDTHLDRFVAVKVLPSEKVADPERKRRFVQEAKTASALNHPNILHIYDIVTGETGNFIAMEYVQGKTLGEFIGRRGLPVRQALQYAVQIADALAAAHAAGIVHRDIKPGNIMVNDKGLVKILDFGLAKLTEAIEGPYLGSTQTIKPETEEGVIVGTVAYMSPEQAEGKKVDVRSDIFSFGSVLYEMITGRRAFRGENRVSTLSAILNADPPAITGIAEGISPELEWIIARCLRKDPDRRIQHMGEVKLALQELQDRSGKLPFPPPGRRRPGLSRQLVAAMFAGLIFLAGVTLWQMRAPQSEAAPTLTRLTADPGLTTDPVISLDGKLVAYASDRSGEGNLDIYVRQIGGGEPIRLSRDSADEREPAFSPDGTQIAFTSGGGGISVVSALGGPARSIVPKGRGPQFSPDGKWIAYWVGSLNVGNLSRRGECKTYVVASAGGAPMQVQPDFANAAYPVWSPDGKSLLILGNRDETVLPEDSVDWWVTTLQAASAIKTGILDVTRREQLVGSHAGYPWVLAAPAWLPDGKSLVFSARSGDTTNLWRVELSPKTWKITKPPQRLTSGPTLEESPSVASRAGGGSRMVFASLTENNNVWSLPIQTTHIKVSGEPQRLTNDAAADFHAVLSRDGNQMAFISNRTGNQELWIKDFRNGQESTLTATKSNKAIPQFSPDGSRISFSSYENKAWNVYAVPAKGGVPELIREGYSTDWSADGKRILGSSEHGGVWLFDIASRRSDELVTSPGQRLGSNRFSPDGRWVILNGEGRYYIVPFGGEIPIVARDWITLTVGEGWSSDGSVIYGLSSIDGFFCVWAQRLDQHTKHPTGDPVGVFHSHSARRSLGNLHDYELFVAKDRLVFSMSERTGNIWMAEWKGRYNAR